MAGFCLRRGLDARQPAVSSRQQEDGPAGMLDVGWGLARLWGQDGAALDRLCLRAWYSVQ
jgi:hypothetical protein